MMKKRSLVMGSMLAAGLGLSGQHRAFAQEFPSRPVKLVVASVPGSAPDVLARVLAETMAPALRQTVVVENKPGAGGVLGVDSVAKAPPDGYTLVIGHDGTMAMSFVVQQKLPYDPTRDFVPVASLGFNEFVLVVPAALQLKNFQEFLAYARSQPNKVRYGSAGNATPNHVIMEQLARAAGFSAVHVPYKGGPAAVQDLVGGQIEAMVAGISPALPHIRSGRLVALAVPQAVRSQVLSEVPTMAETLSGFAVKSWFGLFAPAQTPASIIATLNREVRTALEAPAVRQRIAQQGMAVEVGTSAALAAQVSDDIARYRVLATQIKLDGQ